MQNDHSDLQNSFVTIQGDNGYPLNARYWQADDAQAVLVMIHGLVSHSQWMDSIASILAKQGISCFAVDRRGAGLNTEARGDAPSTNALLNDLHAVVEWVTDLNIPIHLCGFSWGSNYVVNYLAQHQANIASMLYLAPSFFPSTWIAQQPFKVGDGCEATEDPVMPIDQFTDVQMFDAYIKTDPNRLRKVSIRMNKVVQSFSSGIWMKFLRLNYPCLMILGAKDTVIDNDATLQVFDRLQVEQKQSVVLNASHGIQFDMPSAAAHSIAQWVKDTPLKQNLSSKDKALADSSLYFEAAQVSPAKPTIWLRAEHKPQEARTAVTPDVASELIAAGYRVVVEKSCQRALPDQLYSDSGCELVDEHSWQQAPDDAIIIGLKELSAELGPFRHKHVHFAHVYKNQSGWKTFLNEFNKGSGTLYDLEYLVDLEGRRVAAFGYWAGYVGAAIGLLQWVSQQTNTSLGALTPWSDRRELQEQVIQAVAATGMKPDIMVIGAHGRSGGGAVELCQACDLKVTQWGRAETSTGGPFDEMLQHHVMINCVFLDKPMAPFTTMEHLNNSERLLSVISDVSCDPFSDANPLPIYHDCTTMDEPSLRVVQSTSNGQLPVDLISIDHLPSLLPIESSEEFANALLPYLLSLDQLDSGVWHRAETVFNTKSAAARN